MNIPDSNFSELLRRMLVREDQRIALKELKEELKLLFNNYYDFSNSNGQ